MKHRFNSGKPETEKAVGNPEPSPKGKVQRLSREGVGASASKQAGPITGQEIVRFLSKGGAVYVCKRCGEPKRLPDDFYGANRICKICWNKKSSAYQRTEGGKKAHRRALAKWNKKQASRKIKAEYKRSEKGVLSERRYYRSKMERIPDKMRARAILNCAVGRGKIKKPTFCSECHERARLHGHHEDYSKPLVVKWLCSDCHRRVGK